MEKSKIKSKIKQNFHSTRNIAPLNKDINQSEMKIPEEKMDITEEE